MGTLGQVCCGNAFHAQDQKEKDGGSLHWVRQESLRMLEAAQNTLMIVSETACFAVFANFLFPLQGHLLEHADQDKKEQKRQPAQCDDRSLRHVQPVAAQ